VNRHQAPPAAEGEDSESHGRSGKGEEAPEAEERRLPEEEDAKAKEDPDEQQRDYADSIATLQKSLTCIGVHTWSLCAATRVNSSCLGACFALVPSVLLLLLQCFVLHAMSLESLHPTCTRNDNCRAGMWCAPSTGHEGVIRSPGMCDDCKWAGNLEAQDYNNLPSRYDADAYAVMTAASLEDAVAYCTSTDSDLDRCDFLVNFREQLTLAPFVVLLATTCLVLLSLVADMDKQAQIADVFEYRVTHVAHGAGTATFSEYLVTSVAWLIFNLRKFVLPGVVVYTYAALLLAGTSATGVSLPVSFVLDGLAVCFIYNMDSLLALALLDENAQALIREAFADMQVHMRGDHQISPLNAHWLPYCFHRFLVFFFGGLIMLHVLATESLMDSMPLFRLDWDELPMKWVENPSAKTCTNIVTMLGSTTVLAITLFTLVWSVTHQITNSCRRCGPFDVVFAPLVSLLTMPALSYVLLKIGYSPI